MFCFIYSDYRNVIILLTHDETSFSFLIIASLLLFGCRSKTQSNFQPELSEQAEESYSLPEEYAEEVIVTGKVLNRDFYPNEKDLTLIIPFFRKMENQYCAPIQKDGSFSFRFPILQNKGDFYS